MACRVITRLLAVIVTIIFTGCAPIPQSPALVSNVSNAGLDTSGPSDRVAEINRNIAAAAMLGSVAASSDYRIGPEDLIEITLFNVPESDGKITPRTVTARVSQAGIVSLPLLGELSIKGLTTGEAEKELRQLYDKYIYNPQVGVAVKEFRQRVSIIGAVQKPGAYELTGTKTLIELLAMAGGVTEKAGSQVHIYRRGANGRQTHVIDLMVLANSTGVINPTNDAMINMPLEPGDMINIPQSGMFFVDGAVRNPGSYPLGRQYSLTQALATAGGVDPELNSNDVTIMRRRGVGEVQTLALNLTDVRNGHTVDPQIRPDDVIVVPVSTSKYIVKRFIGTLVGGLSIGSFIPIPR